MKLREFVLAEDFRALESWINDERTHALWCANRMRYPLDMEDISDFLRYEKEQYNNKAFIAEDDNGNAIGFYCCSPDNESGECMLKFVIIDPKQRGKGYGREMICLAVEKAFEDEAAEVVQLMVFSENIKAKKCYESAGFKERSTTPDVFTYKNESWGRCNMVIGK